ncbi:unnamed protein product [Prorocentrum cordatum]|uniref:Uncharacterized protein n=1 Tax=Prorocentrum cordatum TaxID=2364126 RepID=A0ABN9U4B9_9DINO|nr:unnamed protein product [Polarella glacialis]
MKQRPSGPVPMRIVTILRRFADAAKLWRLHDSVRIEAKEYPPWLTDAVASPESPRPAGAAAAAEGGPSCECPAPSAAVPEAQPEDAPSPRSAAAASGGAAPERPRTPRTRPHWRGPAGAGEEQPPACAGSCGSAGGGGAAARSRAAPPDRFSALGDVDGALQEYERPAEFGELLQAFHEGARAWAPQRPPGAAPGAVEASAAAPPAGAGRDSSAEGAAFGWL